MMYTREDQCGEQLMQQMAEMQKHMSEMMGAPQPRQLDP